MPSLVVPRLGFLYRILVEAYQWVNRQASCAARDRSCRRFDRVLGATHVQKRSRPRSNHDKTRAGGETAQAPRQARPQDKSQVQVIARAAAILRALEEQPAGLSLGAEKLLIAASPTGRVRLGPTILRLAASARTDFVALARPFLVRLSKQLNETVDLATIKKDHLIFVDQVIGPHRLRAVSAVGETFPLYCTANGKAFLAQLDEVAIARLIGASFERRTANTITRLDELLKELRATRKSGVAFDREEHTLGICAAGVVMRDLLGNDVAISVPVPAQRFHAQEKLIAERLIATRRALEEHLAAAAA
jgi:DNA-binding IclR family transcriptional regulator